MDLPPNAIPLTLLDTHRKRIEDSIEQIETTGSDSFQAQTIAAEVQGIEDENRSLLARHISIGWELRRREALKVVDTIATLGAWFNSMPKGWYYRMVAVSEAFYMPRFPGPVNNQSPELARKYNLIQGYARIQRVLGNDVLQRLVKTDPPMKLLRAMAALRATQHILTVVRFWERWKLKADQSGETVWTLIVRLKDLEDGKGSKNPTSHIHKGNKDGQLSLEWVLFAEWAEGEGLDPVTLRGLVEKTRPAVGFLGEHVHG